MSGTFCFPALSLLNHEDFMGLLLYQSESDHPQLLELLPGKKCWLLCFVVVEVVLMLHIYLVLEQAFLVI